MIEFMMRLLIILAPCGSRSSVGIGHDRSSEGALEFNEKVASSSSHVVDVAEETLPT